VKRRDVPQADICTAANWHPCRQLTLRLGQLPGSRNVNTEPFLGSLATVTSPPIMRASLRVMARPSPVPPKRWAVEASAWVLYSIFHTGGGAVHSIRSGHSEDEINDQ
jgi:hypothetical protein